MSEKSPNIQSSTTSPYDGKSHSALWPLISDLWGPRPPSHSKHTVWHPPVALTTRLLDKATLQQPVLVPTLLPAVGQRPAEDKAQAYRPLPSLVTGGLQGYRAHEEGAGNPMCKTPAEE